MTPDLRRTAIIRGFARHELMDTILVPSATSERRRLDLLTEVVRRHLPEARAVRRSPTRASKTQQAEWHLGQVAGL